MSEIDVKIEELMTGIETEETIIAEAKACIKQYNAEIKKLQKIKEQLAELML